MLSIEQRYGFDNEIAYTPEQWEQEAPDEEALVLMEQHVCLEEEETE